MASPKVASPKAPDAPIAVELAKKQKAISVAEFFEKNRQMLGFDSLPRCLITCIKEAVDNSLDACEEAQILPDIYIRVQRVDERILKVVIEDNGPGIQKDVLPRVFGKLLYGSRFHAIRQSRGQQGIGISAAVLYAQLTSGKPVRITSRIDPKLPAYVYELKIDTETNEPKLLSENYDDFFTSRGTRIELNMEATYVRGRQSVLEYLKNTAIVNPHARIKFVEPKSDKPDPLKIKQKELIEMLISTDSLKLSSFLLNELDKIDGPTMESICKEASLNPRMAPQDLAKNIDDVNRLMASFQKNIKTDPLEIKQEELIEMLNSTDSLKLSSFLLNSFARIDGPTMESICKKVNLNPGMAPQDLAKNIDDVNRLMASFQKIDSHIFIFNRASDTLPKQPVEIKPHPHGIELGTLIKMLQSTDSLKLGSFLSNSFTKIGGYTMESICKEANLDPGMAPQDLANDTDGVKRLMAAFQKIKIQAPPKDCLSPITGDLLKKGITQNHRVDFISTVSRPVNVSHGNPFLVEVAIAYGGDIDTEGRVEIYRIANRVPLMYQQGACAITHAIERINWKNYNMEQPKGARVPMGPIMIMVHLASTNVPFTSESKDAIADIPEIEDEIELTVREAARDLSRYLSEQKKALDARKKIKMFEAYTRELSLALEDLTGKDHTAIESQFRDVLARKYSKFIESTDEPVKEPLPKGEAE